MAALSHPECASFHAAAAPPSSPGWLSLGTQVDTLVDFCRFLVSVRILTERVRRSGGPWEETEAVAKLVF